MNLYATVTSERASKGQGGNKYIEVVLLAVGSASDSKPVVRAYLNADEDPYNYVLKVFGGATGEVLEYTKRIPKGNKQKGDI